MGDSSTIEWTDATWNPVTGCSKVSPGCAHCYAETIALRFWPTQYPHVQTDGKSLAAVPAHVAEDWQANGLTRPRAFTDVMCHEDRLDQPLRWKKPRRVFVNSMSDLFHEDVPDAFIDRMFAVMALAQQHTFQILTKRAERMRAYFDTRVTRHLIAAAAKDLPGGKADGWNGKCDNAICNGPWPLPNVWLGVSVENQHFADERIPLLLQTPAAIRFISAEPLLGPIALSHDSDVGMLTYFRRRKQPHIVNWPGLDWVIVGGESGPGARTFDLAWARSLVQQCQAAGVPVFLKQLGAHLVTSGPTGICGDGPLWRVNGWPKGTRIELDATSGVDVIRLRNRKGGDPDEWPEDLRIREFPRFEVTA